MQQVFSLPDSRSQTALAFGSLLSVCALGLLARYVTVEMLWASLAFLLLLWGAWLRKQRLPHIILMNLGIALDTLLVLKLQINRDAVQTAMEFSLGPWEQLHIGASTVALVLYLPVLLLGWQRHLGYARGAGSRRWHIRLGVSALLFRTIGFFMMFSMLP